MRAPRAGAIAAALCVVVMGCGKAGQEPAPRAEAAAEETQDDDGRTVDYKACTQAAHEVTSNEMDCLEAEFDRQDRALTEAYGALIARLDDNIRSESKTLVPAERLSVGAKRSVEKAQRAWTAWREAECEAVGAPNEGGTIQPIVISNCRIDLTIVRIDDLKSLLDDFG
jgi:uncharacterized protein YecT (DUF1311 family)